MNKTEPVITNNSGEKLDTWVEESSTSIKATVVMVHGFGTSKHETAGYFDDISEALVNDNYRVVRFDLSGYGNSQGREEDACYSKHVHDLHSVLDWVKSNYQAPVYIFAQSMGCWVTALSTPDGITKTIMTGTPNTNTDVVITRVKERFGSRPGAVLEMDGVSLLPRSTGKIQKIGSQFWIDIKNLQPVKIVSDYSIKTKLMVVHWESDEIIGKDYLDGYDQIPTLTSVWLPGDHSVTNKDDRQNFIKKMLEFYNK